jgi:RNA polymerase sigma-70 factor (ECF subfamily)
VHLAVAAVAFGASIVCAAVDPMWSRRARARTIAPVDARSEALDPVLTAERDLVARLRRGDDAAFEELVRTHAGRMLAVARRLLRSDDDAQDALQEAFLAVYKAIGHFNQESRLGTWLHRIVVNAALMKLRSRGRRPEGSIEDLLPKFQEDGHHADPPDPWQESASEIVARGEMRACVRRSIDELPDNYRTVLLLRDIDELDTDETAKIMGLTPNAVKVRLHRARQALRSLIDSRMREARP